MSLEGQEEEEKNKKEKRREISCEMAIEPWHEKEIPKQQLC
jgi:hypothetical protein